MGFINLSVLDALLVMRWWVWFLVFESFERVSKGPHACQPKSPSKPLQNAFKNPWKTFQEGVESMMR